MNEQLPTSRAQARGVVPTLLALLILLALTVVFSMAHLGSWALAIAMLIAVIKALIIAVRFMKLREATPTIRLAAAAGLLWLLLMMTLTLADVLTRH